MKYGEEILVLNESHLNFALCYLLMVDCKLSYANLIADEKWFIYKMFSQNLSHFITQYCYTTAVLLYNNS